MGYTHYWKIKGNIGPRVWARIVNDTQALLAVSTIPLLGEEDVPGSPPIANTEVIRFNGVGEDGHETFSFDRLPSDEFCKTAQKPYDRMVCAVLIVAAKHAPRQVLVSSDGWRHEWLPALGFVHQTLGTDYTIPKHVEADPGEHAVQNLSANELELRLYGKHGYIPGKA